MEVAWLPQGWECSPLNMGFSGWGQTVVLLVTLGDTGRELLLLSLLAHQAALHFPPLTCGIFPSHHHFQSPISILGKEDSTPTFTLAMGLGVPHALGWFSVHPTARAVSKLQSQHPNTQLAANRHLLSACSG